MKTDRIEKWKEDMEIARDWYKNTDMNESQIARALRISPTTVNKMITGKNLPKFMLKDSEK